MQMRLKSSIERTVWMLVGEISDRVTDYIDFINYLDDAVEGDGVLLKINSTGGSISTGMMIVDAIRHSNATVVAEIIHPSYSMASLIALACDYVIFRNSSFLMFHDASTGGYGKLSELSGQHVNYTKFLMSEMDKLMYPFFSRAEIKRILSGEDRYIHHDDETLTKRVERHYKVVVLEEDIEEDFKKPEGHKHEEKVNVVSSGGGKGAMQIMRKRGVRHSRRQPRNVRKWL
jgi:hypothetical protein